MSNIAIDDQTLSLKLSRVMEDIGVSKKIILKRRKSFQLMEALDTITRRVIGKNITTYNLGSQSEGSTTMDLDSDIDTLFGYHDLNIIRNWNEAKPGAQNVLMVQEESTATGHCFLQFQSPEVVLAMTNLGKRHFVQDCEGRWLLKNTCFDDNYNVIAAYKGLKSGPAHVIKGDYAYTAEDNVIAWHCKHWPKEAQQWLGKANGWPTDEIKRNCKATGCIIVPVSSKNSQFEEIEWRISTCLAERCIMFSLNLTKMRCYVLMKMLCSKINEYGRVKISSYVCKNILFYCISKSYSSESQATDWTENNLLECLEKCLLYLELCIRRQNCQHFFIPGYNLLKGKNVFGYAQKLSLLINVLSYNKRLFLEFISIDNLYERLSASISDNRDLVKHIQSIAPMSSTISGKLLNHIAVQLDICHRVHLIFINSFDKPVEKANTFLQHLSILVKTECDSSAFDLIMPFFSSSLASAITSKLIDKKCIHSYASYLFKLGLNSEVSSGKLKYACALYSTGDMKTTTRLLERIEHDYDKTTVNTVCSCIKYRKGIYNLHDRIRRYRDKADTGNEELIKEIMSFCVKFLPCEINCIPRELKYEMFRSTAEDKLYKNENINWDWPAVDSLPFLFFLQYKTYGRLKMAEKQKIALENFQSVTDREYTIGHKETALNLLGQCMEQENRFSDALGIYIQSLGICRRNNAAKIHICSLICALYSKTMS